MVAKSFQSMTQIGEPFENNKKMYVIVRNEKTGCQRKVRWYTPKEYSKMYPEAKLEITDTGFRNLKKTLGFTKGYITIFCNSDLEQNQEVFRASNARNHVAFGWYIVSTEEVPEELKKFNPKQLFWEEVSINENQLRDFKEIETIVRSKYAEALHYGAIGQRYDFNVQIINIVPIGANQYGAMIRYEFTQDNHLFCWITKERNFSVGDTWKMRGTVKGFEGKYTVLTRCMEVK